MLYLRENELREHPLQLRATKTLSQSAADVELPGLSRSSELAWLPFVILPHEKFAKAGYIQRIMRIVTRAKILKKGETLIVKDDSILSESSDSEYCGQ
jgi:hypothetical protein